MLERGNFEANKKFLKELDIDWRNLRVLDIGCGNGSMTNFLTSLGAKVIGIDINKKYLKTAKKRFPSLEFKNMSGDELLFDDEYFDIVVSFDLLEHIPDVEKHILEVLRVLKDKGKYLLQTPNKYPSMLFSIYRDKSFSKWKSYHPSLQTKKSIRHLFKDFRVEFCNVDYFTDWYRNKLPKSINSINPQSLGLETNLYIKSIKNDE